MPIEKRSHTIEDFFKKKQKSNKHDTVSDASDDSPDLTDFQVNNSFNHNTLKINSQTTTTLDGCFDMCAVSRSIEDILGSVERADDDTCTMPSTAEPNSGEKTALLDIGSDLLQIKRAIEECNNLIKRTTEIDESREKILYDVSEFAHRVKLASKTILDKCSMEIESLKTDRHAYTIKDSNKNDIINHDPGTYANQHKFSDDELRYLLSKGPFQPVIDFPVNEEYKSRKQTCKFVPSWYNSFPYLEYSIVKNKIYCFVCRLFGTGVGCEKADLAWTTGIDKWNRMKSRGKKQEGKLVVHFTSKSHTAALERYKNFMTKKNHVDLMLDSRKQQAEQQRESILKFNCTIVSTLIDITRFLSRQNLSFRGHSGNEEEGNFAQLVSLLRRHNASFDQWFCDTSLRIHHVTYISPNSQNEFIQLIGKEVHDEVLKRIHEVPFLSIMVDSTPDVTHQEMYSIIVRYCRNFEVEERLFSLDELNSKVGKKIVEYIISTFNKYGVSSTKIIGQSYDGAPNMNGKNAGVQSLLSEYLEKNVLFIPCGAHTSDLVVKHSSSCSVEFISLYESLQGLYNYITSSVKRNEVYTTKIENTGYGLLLKDLCRTRWYARYESLNAVFTSFHVLVQCLIDLEHEGDAASQFEAKTLLNKILSFEFVVLLLFTREIMASTNATTIQLQKKDLDILSAIEMLSSLLNLLKNVRNDDNHFIKIIEEAEKLLTEYGTDFEAEFERLHRPRRVSCRIDSNNKNGHVFTRTQFYSTLFRKILDQLCTEYESYLKVLKETLYWFRNLSPSTVNNFDQVDAEHLVEIVPGLNDSLLLTQEMKQLTPAVIECSNPSEIANLLKNKCKYYPRVGLLYQFVFTLPITVASNERSFSKLKLIKTRLRSTMTNERLFHLMISSLEYDLLDQIDIQKLVNDWTKMKDRRICVKN